VQQRSLIQADAFREINGFDERFFCYVEDVDLGFRRCRGRNAAALG
jgi:GT2 family glycosyltransferase